MKRRRKQVKKEGRKCLGGWKQSNRGKKKGKEEGWRDVNRATEYIEFDHMPGLCKTGF